MHISILNAYNDRPIAFNRHYVTIGCGITGALMLSQAVYWSSRTKDSDGWFYKTRAEWEEETGLTRREQETARKALKDLDILQEIRRGVPAKLYYRVDVEQVHNHLISALDLHDNQEWRKAPYCDDVKRQTTNTDITTETTTYTSIEVERAFDLFWSAGMRKINRKKSLDIFRSIVKKGKLNPEHLAISLADDVRKRIAAKQYGFDTLHPTTYLTNERWNDEIVQTRSVSVYGGKNQSSSEAERQAINDAAYNSLFGDDFQGETIDV